MAEITSDGYQNLRDHVNGSVSDQNAWDWIALYDDSQSEVLRVSVTGDSRASWTDVDADALLTANITIQGSDSDVPTPTAFEYSALWDDASGGSDPTQVTQLEQYATATINQDGDELTVEHTVELPDQ